MLQFLLDEHLAPRIVKEFLRQCPGAAIGSVLEWQDGRLAGVPDDVLLVEAYEHRLTLVTYDQATVAPLLKSWAEQGIPHYGIVFIDDRTIRPNDFGGIVRALSHLWRQHKHANWHNRVIYLTRAARE